MVNKLIKDNIAPALCLPPVMDDGSVREPSLGPLDVSSPQPAGDLPRTNKRVSVSKRLIVVPVTPPGDLAVMSMDLKTPQGGATDAPNVDVLNNSGESKVEAEAGAESRGSEEPPILSALTLSKGSSRRVIGPDEAAAEESAGVADTSDAANTAVPAIDAAAAAVDAAAPVVDAAGSAQSPAADATDAAAAEEQNTPSPKKRGSVGSRRRMSADMIERMSAWEDRGSLVMNANSDPGGFEAVMAKLKGKLKRAVVSQDQDTIIGELQALL